MKLQFTRTGYDRHHVIMRWFEKNGYNLCATEIGSKHELSLFKKNGKFSILMFYGNDAYWQIFVPVTEKNSVSLTLDALENYVSK